MQIHPGKMVYTMDGEKLGKVEKIVISPVSRSIESLIIQRGLLFSEERVVPIRLVDESSDGKITLKLKSPALQTLPRYRDTHYIDSLASDRGDPGSATLYYLHPLDSEPEGDLLPNYPSPPIVERSIENIPPGSYVLEEGSEIYDRSGKQVGHVEQILTDPVSHSVTHFVISRGLVFETEKLIPAQWIDSVADGQVNLGVEKELIQRLPEYAG
jgi:sporulation protein YlmC with PRC-barrel domain